MNGKLRLLLGLFCLALTAQAAEARRFRIFPIPGLGGSRETIDLVHDLPNEELFRKEGQYFDVGWLNGRYGSGYVIYHGDRYSRLDSEGIALLKGVLGFDPTAQHRAQLERKAAQYAIDHPEEIARQKAERAHKEERIASGRMIERREGESSADYAARTAAFLKKHRSASSSRDPFASNPTPQNATAPAQASSGSSRSFVFGLATIFVLILLFAGRKLYAGIFGLARAVSGDASHDGGSAGDSDHLSFEQRVAKRLSELQAGGDPQGHAGPQDDHISTAPDQDRPAARTFGRKTA